MYRILYFLALLSGLIFTSGCDRITEKDVLFRRSLATSDTAERRQLFGRIIDRYPGSEQAAYCRAALLDSSRNYERIRLLNDAIRKNPEFAEAYNLRGQVKSEMCFFRYALRDFEMATSVNREFAEAFYNKANIYRMYRYINEALGAYDTAIMLRPDFAEAWLNRGVTNELLQQNKDALRDFSKAIELSPANAEIWLDRGIVKGKMKDYNGSLADLRKALQLRPDYGKAWQNKGITEYMAGVPDSACNSWGRAAELGIEDARKALEKYCSK